MKTQQKALIVKTNAVSSHGLDELNIALGRGWRVVHVSPMGGTACGEEEAAACLAALVVIERADEAEAEPLVEVEEEPRELVEGDGSSVDVEEL